jgi:hypothetical protein
VCVNPRSAASGARLTGRSGPASVPARCLMRLTLRPESCEQYTFS